MIWGEALRLASQAIARSGLRSFLTSLGIIIGVGSVIAMVTIGEGATARVGAELSGLGTDLLLVLPGQFGPGRASLRAPAFDAGDVAAMRAQLRAARAVAPVAQRLVRAVRGSLSHQTTLIGTEASYLVTQEWELAGGRAFYEAEQRAGRAVCVLGETLRAQLFPDARRPLGARVRLEGVSCVVIGVLEAKGASGMGLDQDDALLIPLRAFQRRFSGTREIGRIHVAAQRGVDTARVQDDIARLLRERRGIGPGEEDDFTVRDMRQMIQAVTGATSVLTQLLGVVAAVSLVVGGIGIMNIMLVSVTERTREIGIRLAVGALEGQVLTQFLVEATALSLAGGLAGIVLGLGLAALVCGVLALPFAIDWGVVATAFAVSAGIGIGFGYVPARRAARLDPIEALRRE